MWRGVWASGSRGGVRGALRMFLRGGGGATRGSTPANTVGDVRISYKQPEVYTRGRWWSEHNFTAVQRWFFGSTFLLAGASYSVLPEKWENTTTRQMLKHFAAEEERRGCGRGPGGRAVSAVDVVRAHAPLVSALTTAASVGVGSLMLGLPALGTLCCMYSSSLLAHSVWAVVVEKGEASDTVRAELHQLHEDVVETLRGLDALDEARVVRCDAGDGVDDAGEREAAEVLCARVWAAWERFGELHVLGAAHRAPVGVADALNHSGTLVAAVMSMVGVRAALRHGQMAPRTMLTNSVLGLLLGFMVGASVHGFSKRLPGYLGTEPTSAPLVEFACKQPLVLGGYMTAWYAAYVVSAAAARTKGSLTPYAGVALLLGLGLTALTVQQCMAAGERSGYVRTEFFPLKLV